MEQPKSTVGISIKALWPLFIPVLILLPGLWAFPYPSANAAYSDISVTHYPNAIFLKRSILEWGQIPLWSSSILSGYPFAANPLSGLWYPPGWFAVIFPLPLGFNLTVIFHMLMGAVGMYLLARRLGRSHFVALFAALAFEAMPKVFAHYGAGHLSMVYAISLTPLLLLAELLSWQKFGDFWLRQPGIFLALIALADVRWALYAGLFWIAFSFFGSPHSMKRKVAPIIKQALLAFALASPLLLPMIEYSQLSTRANLTPSDLLAFSLPPAGFFGLLAPSFGGPHEWVIYAGAIVFSLAIFQIASSHKDRLDLFWIGSAGVALVFSLGEYMPGISQLTQLPILSSLRVPPRVLPIASLSLIFLAAGPLDSLMQSNHGHGVQRRTNLVLFSVFALLIALAAAIWSQTHVFPIAYLWVMAIVIAFFMVVWLFSTKRIPVAWFSYGILALTMVDLITVDSTLYSPRSKSTVMAESSVAATFLAYQPGKFRVYSPSYSIPQQMAAEFGLELADGVDPLQLQKYVDFMELTTGVPSLGYSITLPPFANGNPVSDNRLARPDVTRLAMLNVAFVASEFEMDIEGLDFVREYDGINLYKVSESLPRTYIVDDDDQTAIITKWTPNRIEIEADGPGRLVLSELLYPGWVATVDGMAIPIEPYEGIFRSVLLSEGVHQVNFEFHPLSVYLGLAIFFAATGSLIVLRRRK